MRYVSVVLCGIVFMSLVSQAQVYKRMQPRVPEPPREITKDTKTGAMFGVESGFVLTQGHDADRFIVDSGIKLGYNLFFTNTWGMRLYGSYNYNFSDFITAYRDATVVDGLYVNTHTFLFNSDVLYDFYNNNDSGLSLGLLFGVGIGYELGTQGMYIKSGFKTVANAGFSLTFHSKHKVEILYRYAILQPSLQKIVKNGQQETYKSQSPFAFYIGYSYEF